MDPLPLVIQSDRLLLRRWRPEEAPALHDAIAASVEHLRPWMPWIAEEPLTVPERRQLIERWDREAAAGDAAHYAAWEAGVVVAGAGLHHRLGPGGLEIGYWVHVDHVGRGIATEVAGLLTEVAFTRAAVDRVEIHHDVANRASGRVPEKLGYRHVGEIAVDDPVVAPAETGRRSVWRTSRPEWARRSGSGA